MSCINAFKRREKLIHDGAIPSSAQFQLFKSYSFTVNRLFLIRIVQNTVGWLRLRAAKLIHGGFS